MESKRLTRRLYSSLVGGWETKRPVWMLFLLYQLGDAFNHYLNDHDQQAPMLDVYLAQKAQDSGKKLRSIESPQEQCNPLESIGEEKLMFAINYTLAYLEWLEDREDVGRAESDGKMSGMAELIQHYRYRGFHNYSQSQKSPSRCGSLASSVFSARRFVQSGFTLTPKIDDQAKAIDLLLVEDIIRRRNVRMARRAHQLLHDNPSKSHFFALGAGHFLGEGSLLDMLRDKYGYTVRAVEEKNGESLLARMREERYRVRRKEQRFNAIWVREAAEANHERLRPLPPAGIALEPTVDVSISLYEYSPEGGIVYHPSPGGRHGRHEERNGATALHLLVSLVISPLTLFVLKFMSP